MLRSNPRLLLNTIQLRKLRKVHVYIKATARTKERQDFTKLEEIFTFLGFSSASGASGAEMPSLTVRKDNLSIRFAPAQQTGFLDRLFARGDQEAFNIEGIHISRIDDDNGDVCIELGNGEGIGDGGGIGALASSRPPYFTVSEGSEEDGSGLGLGSGEGIHTDAVTTGHHPLVKEGTTSSPPPTPTHGEGTHTAVRPVRGVKEVVVPCGEANYRQLSSVRQLLCGLGVCVCVCVFVCVCVCMYVCITVFYSPSPTLLMSFILLLLGSAGLRRCPDVYPFQYTVTAGRTHGADTYAHTHTHIHIHTYTSAH
jgi:hypothetical protein